MMLKKFLSLSFETEHPDLRTYLGVMGAAFSICILTISNADGSEIAPLEEGVYAGEPIDFSSRDDVTFIDRSSDQSDFSNEEVTPSYTNNPLNKSQVVVSQTNLNYQSKYQVLRSVLPKQLKTRPFKITSIEPNAQIELSKLFNIVFESFEGKDSDVIVFYANVVEIQESNSVKQSSPLKTKSVKQKSPKYLIQKKHHTKSNEVKLKLKSSKSENSKLKLNKAMPNISLSTSVEGHDLELVAFFMDVLQIRITSYRINLSPHQQWLLNKHKLENLPRTRL